MNEDILLMIKKPTQYFCVNCSAFLFETKKQSSQKEKTFIISNEKKSFIFRKKNENEKIVIDDKVNIQQSQGDDIYCVFFLLKCKKCLKECGRIYKTGNTEIDYILDYFLFQKDFVKTNKKNNLLNNESVIKEDNKDSFKSVEGGIDKEEQNNQEVVDIYENMKKIEKRQNRNLKRCLSDFSIVLSEIEKKINVSEEELIYLYEYLQKLEMISKRNLKD